MGKANKDGFEVAMFSVSKGSHVGCQRNPAITLTFLKKSRKINAPSESDSK